MAVLSPPRISTAAFTFAGGMFAADASDLTGQLRLGRVYDDACDEGFTLVSHRTSREVVFALHHEERDREGDLLYTEFRPASPHQRGIAPVRIYND